MDNIRKIYEEIMECKPSLDFKLDISGIREAIFESIMKVVDRARECQEAGIDIHDDPVINELLHKKEEREEKVRDFGLSL